MSLVRPNGPDPTAPSTPTGLLSALTKIQSTLSFFLFLPFTLIRTGIKHLLGHYPSWQSPSVSLLAQTIKLLLWSRNLLYLPAAHVGEWKITKAVVPAAKAARVGMRVKMVEVEPAEKGLIVDVADVRGVEAVKRPGFWVWPEQGYAGGTDGMAGEGEKVVYYLHGGAYLFGHPIETGFSWNMSRKLNLRVFGINYRKTLSTSTAHPAPLLDALAGYLYLTRTLKFAASDITITGDSAGAHLVLFLTRYLAHISLPIPTTLALCSPWSDFTSTPESTNFASHIDNYEYDFIPYLSHLSLTSGMRHYTPEARRSLYFSPVLARGDEWDYLRNKDSQQGVQGTGGKGGIRVYVMYGTKEILADEIVALVDGMKEAGVDVFLRKDVEGLHVGPTMAWSGSNALQIWLDDCKALVDGDKLKE